MWTKNLWSLDFFSFSLGKIQLNYFVSPLKEHRFYSFHGRCFRHLNWSGVHFLLFLKRHFTFPRKIFMGYCWMYIKYTFLFVYFVPLHTYYCTLYLLSLCHLYMVVKDDMLTELMVMALGCHILDLLWRGVLRCWFLFN